MLTSILTAGAVMLALAGLLTALLVAANMRLAIAIDPRQQTLDAVLPQANCGGCGYPSCAAYAQAVASGKAPHNRCTVGGPPVAQQIAGVLGIEVTPNYPFRPVIHCGATTEDRLGQGHYVGERTCAAAHVVGGVQGCTYGCLGYGDCVDSCEYDAMDLVDGLPRIHYDNCVGCGACVRACPREIIEQVPFKVERMLVVACANHDPGKAVREVCRVGCVGCGVCARQEPELFSIQNNLASLDYQHFTGAEDCGKVVDKCPMESLVLLGKPLPALQDQIADVAPRHDSGRPPVAVAPSPMELDWRG